MIVVQTHAIADILEAICWALWIVLGIWFFFKYRKLNKRMNGIAKELEEDLSKFKEDTDVH